MAPRISMFLDGREIGKKSAESEDRDDYGSYLCSKCDSIHSVNYYHPKTMVSCTED